MHQSETHFLKQYTCLQFTNYLYNTGQPSRSVKLISKGNNSYINSNLPNQILDGYSGTDKLYILKWQSKNANATTLDIFLYSSQIFNRIQMDIQPSFLTIIDKFIYIIIGSELLIIRHENMALQKTYSLGSDIIHAIEPAFSQIQNHQLGVEIYSWHQKKGFRKRFYSIFQGAQQKWWSTLKSALFEYASLDLKNSTLHVLIPNVLGVIIMQNLSSLVLVNLNSMQAIQKCAIKLTKWSIKNPKKCIMKHYISKRQEGYDDDLIISIGQKDRQLIELFVFKMKYLPSIIKTENEVSIKSIQTGEIVDWANSSFKPLLTISTEGSLIDYLLVEKGLIFFSNTKSKIPVAGFSNYSDPLNTHRILCLEHNICSSYLQDHELYSMMQEKRKELESTTDPKSKAQIQQQLGIYEQKLINSMFKPNRYSKNLLLLSCQVDSIQFLNFSLLNPRKLLIDWNKNYKVKGIYTLNRDIVIVRENSITTLLPITYEQYQSQYQNPDIFFEMTNKISEGEPIKSIYSFELSVNSSKYSLNKPVVGTGQLYQNWWMEMNQFESEGYSYQREGTSSYNQRPSQYEQIFQKYIKKLRQKILTNGFPNTDISQQGQNLISSKSILFSRSIILNRVKDLILFYSKILKFTFAKSSERNSTSSSSKYGKSEKNMVNYLSMLEVILNNAWRQNCGLNDDLISKYIDERINKMFENIKQEYQKLKQSSQKLQNETSNSSKLIIEENVDIIIDVQKQSWKIIKTMFFDIIFQDNGQDISVNSFIKSLIQTLNQGYQYIGVYLSTTFYPYETIFPLPYTQNQSELFGMTSEPYMSWQKQQLSFPLTPTLLTIYSYLQIPDEVRKIIFTSYISKYISDEGQDKSLNKILSKLPISQSIKEKIGEIYCERLGFNDNQKLNRKTLQRLDTDQKTEKGNSKNNQQIDYSRGIIYLTKVLQPQAIQNYLLEIEQKQLQPIFRANIQNILEENLDMRNRVNKSTGSGQNYTVSDYLTSWIIKFRVYVFKFKGVIQLIDKYSDKSPDKSSRDKQKDFSLVKNVVIKYVENCIKSFDNVKKYYQNLYRIKGIRQKLQRNCNTLGSMDQHDTDEEIIEKVCCKMLGYDEVDQLYLYEEKPKQIDNKDGEGCKVQRILPTPSFFRLILTLLKDKETYVESLKDQESIAFYFLKRILESPKQNAEEFRTINKYFSRQWLSKFIENSGTLKELFIQLPQNQQMKGCFGYIDLSKFDRSSNQSISKIMQRQSSKGLSALKNLRESQNMNKHKNLPFRNAYLEAVSQ